MRYLVFIIMLAALGALEARAADLKCPVSDDGKIKYEKGNVSADAWRDVKREATPREAGRIAAQKWRWVQRQSNNLDLSPAWLDQLTRCQASSGLAFSQLVDNPVFFRHVVLRTLRKNLGDLRKSAEVQGVERDLAKYNERLRAVASLDPALGALPEFKALGLPPAESAALVKQSLAAAALEHAKCSPRDFAAELGPVRDQGPVGWCYAYAASDMLTYWLKKQNAPEAFRVSATDVAFHYNRKYVRDDATESGLDTSSQEGGWMAKALKATLPAGFCSERDAPSEDFAYGSLKDTIDEIEKFKREAVGGRLPDACYAYERTAELFPGIAFDDFADILDTVGDRNLEYFERLSEKNCAGKRKMFGLSADQFKSLKVGIDDEKAETVLAALDEQLSRGNISTIAVHQQLLDNRSGAHALTLVGRKYDEATQSCRYLLRNSWGPGCSPRFHDGICAEEHSGHVWVSKASLLENLMEGDYIAP